ncbi:Putative ribonuclease H protein [Arachis hypogaea]|nr:Putative ribonuclease H protein [Arachis hypogaea]
MTKVGWELIENKNALWARVLRSKYRSGNDIIPKVERKQSSSNLWKGICVRWDIAESNHIWCIGNGSKIDSWKHNWVPRLGKLEHHITQVSNDIDYSVNLTDFFTVSGSWDIVRLKEILLEDVVKRIVALSPQFPLEAS